MARLLLGLQKGVREVEQKRGGGYLRKDARTGIKCLKLELQNLAVKDCIKHLSLRKRQVDFEFQNSKAYKNASHDVRPDHP